MLPIVQACETIARILEENRKLLEIADVLVKQGKTEDAKNIFTLVNHWHKEADQLLNHFSKTYPQPA